MIKVFVAVFWDEFFLKIIFLKRRLTTQHKTKNMDKILLLNGPNTNMFGRRPPAIYGTETLNDIEQMVKALGKEMGYGIDYRQSNEKGFLINNIQQAPNWAKGIILNAGGLTHYAWDLRDAVEIARDLGTPTVEIHISNIHQRESFRDFSVFSTAPSVVLKQICGEGVEGYCHALRALVAHLKSGTQA